MKAKKSAPKRKRAAPAPSKPKKKQTVAAKKKHVRELAKACRWAEIENLYGKTILAKAKTFAQKNGAVKTPNEIAQEILLKNGYLPSVPHQPVGSTMKKRVESTTPVSVPEVHNAPTLTREQQELVEKRRRDALERRKRAHQATVVPMNYDGNARELHHELQSVAELQHRHVQPQKREQIMQSRKLTRVVTPENLPTANAVVEAEPVRPKYFWDDLEAAAELVQWENEHMAEAALEQPPTKTTRDFNGVAGIIQQGEINARSCGIPSLSQELAAAAEIIQWENEHEVSSEIPVDSDPEVETPQFQLLSAHTGFQNQQGFQEKVESHLKRTVVAPPPPALLRSVDFNKAVGANQRQSASSFPAQPQRDPTAEFIDKHILEDKLKFTVLEFLDMMLA